MRRRAGILLLLFGWGLLLVACARPPTETFCDCLIVLSDAAGAKYVKLYGSDQLSYSVKEQYPATRIVLDIMTQVQQKGWKPLEEDYLNPGLFNSNSSKVMTGAPPALGILRGWHQWQDVSVSPPRYVHSWQGQWTKSNGDVLVYVFRYHDIFGKDFHELAEVLNGPKTNRLTVAAIYIPAAVAQAELEAAEQSRNAQKQ